MYKYFENLLLREAGVNPSPQQPPQQQQPLQNDPAAAVQQSPPPPDFTSNPAAAANQDPNAGGADTGADQAQMPAGPPPQGGLDPSMGGADPNAADPNADPNAQVQGDPNDPNAQGDPNADPNAMGGDPNAGMDAAPQPGAEIDQAEQDTFADLKPEQMILKNTELKERYQEVYKAATDSLEKINKISRTTYDDVMLDFIVKKLTNLKSMIVDSLEGAFPTRTYAENKIELQRFILGFNFLTNLITQIYQSRLKRQQKISELNSKTEKGRDPEEFPIFTRGYDIQ